MLTRQRDKQRDTPSSLARWCVFLKRVILGLVRCPRAAFALRLKQAPTSASRRALLLGRFGKLISPPSFSPLVTRLPHPDKPQPSQQVPRTIQGISIEPVPPTNLNSPSISQTFSVHRPPGAIEEVQFLAECTRCGDCIEACPHDAIVPAPVRLGDVAGSPVVEADRAACWMCDDFPCITSCQPHVLTNLLPPVMGTARVTAQLCIAHHGTTCSVCSERCPVEGAMYVEAGKPRVNEEACTGCGVCRYVCPAPENAILLMPVYARPRKPPA